MKTFDGVRRLLELLASKKKKRKFVKFTVGVGVENILDQRGG